MKIPIVIVTLACAGAGCFYRLAQQEEGEHHFRPLSRLGRMGFHGQDKSSAAASDREGRGRSGPTPASAPAVRAENESRGQREDAGKTAVSDSVTATTPEEGAGRRVRFPDNIRRAVLPLTYQDLAPGTVSLEPAQAAAAAAVQDEFANAVGSDPEDPSATDYRNRWQQEQSLNDQRLRAMIGGQAYARWQREAYLHSRKTEGNAALSFPTSHPSTP